jgi:hypothetical protein
MYRYGIERIQLRHRGALVSVGKHAGIYAVTPDELGANLYPRNPDLMTHRGRHQRPGYWKTYHHGTEIEYRYYGNLDLAYQDAMKKDRENLRGLYRS